MATIREKKLFSPVQIGPISLHHRVVMAPLTRSRSQQPGDIPSDLMAEYYGQRASEGGLIISEATTISISGRGWFGAPGLYSDEQIAGWKKVIGAVHSKGGRMFSQLWHTGRSSHVSMTNGATLVAPSVIPEYWQDSTPSVSTPSGWVKPSPHRALDISEIPGIVEDYCKAAERAKAAGFDGSSFTPPTAICPMNSCRMAATSARTPMVGRWRTAPASYWKWWRQWYRCGAATASLRESGPPERGTRCQTATRPYSSITLQ